MEAASKMLHLTIDPKELASARIRFNNEHLKPLVMKHTFSIVSNYAAFEPDCFLARRQFSQTGIGGGYE